MIDGGRACCWLPLTWLLTRRGWGWGLQVGVVWVWVGPKQELVIPGSSLWGGPGWKDGTRPINGFNIVQT